MKPIKEFISGKVSVSVKARFTLDEVIRLKLLQKFYFSPSKTDTLRRLVNEKYRAITKS